MAKSASSRAAKSALPVAKAAQKKKGETNAGPRKAAAVVGAVGKQAKEGPVIDVQEKTPCAKRGARLTLPQVEIVEKAYVEATQANPHLSSIGFSKDGEIATAFD